MAARRKPKQAAKAAKGKERVEPHFGGPKRATAGLLRAFEVDGDSVGSCLGRLYRYSPRGATCPFPLLRLVDEGDKDVFHRQRTSSQVQVHPPDVRLEGIGGVAP